VPAFSVSALLCDRICDLQDSLSILFANKALLRIVIIGALGLISGTVFLRLWQIIAPKDHPDERSNHRIVTQTSGGAALMASTLFVSAIMALWFAPSLYLPFSLEAMALIGLSLSMGVMGWLDDLMDLNALPKLLLQTLMALWFASLYPIKELNLGYGLLLVFPSYLGVFFGMAWLILVMNTINFMDGANGLAVGAQFIWLIMIVLSLLGMVMLTTNTRASHDLSLIVLSAAAAHIPLLISNIKGRIFQGDSGSLFAGALIGGALLIMISKGWATPWLGAFWMAPFLVDVLWTLFVRASIGKNILKAHREHLYQLWLAHIDPSHTNLAKKIWALAGFSAFLGIMAAPLGPISQAFQMPMGFSVFSVWFLSLSLIWWHLRAHCLRQSDPSANHQ